MELLTILKYLAISSSDYVPLLPQFLTVYLILHFIYLGKLFLFFLKGGLAGLLMNISEAESYVKTYYDTNENVASAASLPRLN